MKNLLLFFVMVLLIPATLVSQVKINEVLYNPSTGGDMVELKNFGSSAVDVSGWWFCSKQSYNPISGMTVESGNINIPPDGFLVLSGRDFVDPADLGLYINNNSFADENNMSDFVQWGGAQTPNRETEAARKGIWTAGEFAPSAASGSSIEYDGVGIGAGAWAETATPTLGAENSNVTSVEGPAGIPENFSLGQNFPNPFNPSTEIRFNLKQSGPTVLKIYNMLGQEMATLVDENLQVGPYKITFEPFALPSGVYIYRLQSNGLTEARKMLLLR